MLADNELNGWVRDRFPWLLLGSTTLTDLALRSNRFWVTLVVCLVTLAERSMGHPACTFKSNSYALDSWALDDMPIFDLLVHDPTRPLHERIAHWQTQVAPSIFQEVSKLYDWLGVSLESRDLQPTPEQQNRLLDQLIQRADPHGDKVLREKLLAAAPLVVQLNSLKELFLPHQLAPQSDSIPDAKPSLPEQPAQQVASIPSDVPTFQEQLVQLGVPADSITVLVQNDIDCVDVFLECTMDDLRDLFPRATKGNLLRLRLCQKKLQ